MIGNGSERGIAENGGRCAATSRSIVYLAIAFGISWTAISIAWLQGARVLAEAGLAGNLFLLGPPIAALTCAVIFEKGRRIGALGLWLRPNRWWLLGVILPIVMDAYVRTTEAMLGLKDGITFADPHQTIAAMLKLRTETLGAGWAGIAIAVVVIAFGFSVLFTLTEEMGWRGYLYRQWRPLGFWRYSLLTGLVWGAWHWPMVVYFGLAFGHDRLAGVIYYPLETMSLAPIMTLLRDRSGSVWATGLYHGISNIIGIILFNELGRHTEPNFFLPLLMLPPLLLVELFRRKWPHPQEAAERLKLDHPLRAPMRR